MKKLLLTLALLLAPTASFAQCNGVFPNNTVCGNVTGAGNLPRPTSPSAFIGSAGGTNGQIQYNNAGALGGFTAGQDATINTGTGAVNITKIQNVPVDSTGAATNDVFYYNGSGWIHKTFVSLVNAICLASPSICVSIFGYVYPAWYGAVCDGVTNDAVALQAALTAASGKTVFLPAATCLTNSTLLPVSTSAITGAGREVSILKSTANPAFSIVNKTAVSITNIQILGTNSVVSWSGSPRGPISLQQDNSAAAGGSDFSFSNLKLLGWNVTYWVYIATSGSTFPMNNVFIENNLWISDAASVPTDGDPQNNSNALLVVLSAGSGNGRIENLVVNNNQIEATGACFGILNYANTYKYRFTNNNILNPGATSTSHCTNALPATNAYGITVYDLNADGNPATNGLISGNFILNPKAAGIYITGDGAHTTRGFNSIFTEVSNNLIQNQTSIDAPSSRGAIVVALSTDVAVIGNALYGNERGINITGQMNGQVSVLSNHVLSSVYALSLAAGSNGSSNSDRRIVHANYFEGTDDAVLYTSATGARFHYVDFSGNTLAGTSAVNMGSNFFSDISVFAHNTIVGGTTSFGSITGNLTLTANSGLSFSAAALPAATNGSNAFVNDGAPASACTGSSTGSMGFRQNGAWKCF